MPFPTISKWKTCAKHWTTLSPSVRFAHDCLEIIRSLLAFYKNCLLDLTTHRTDVDYALNTIYFEHCEDILLTPFLKAMCSHLSADEPQ